MDLLSAGGHEIPTFNLAGETVGSVVISATDTGYTVRVSKKESGRLVYLIPQVVPALPWLVEAHMAGSPFYIRMGDVLALGLESYLIGAGA
jgi:hypothetical protein